MWPHVTDDNFNQWLHFAAFTYYSYSKFSRLNSQWKIWNFKTQNWPWNNYFNKFLSYNSLFCSYLLTFFHSKIPFSNKKSYFKLAFNLLNNWIDINTCQLWINFSIELNWIVLSYFTKLHALAFFSL